MRVAIDARTLQGSDVGGVGRALANLLPHLREHVDIELLLNARGGPLNPRTPAGLGQRALRAPLPGGTAWLQLAAPRYLRRMEGAGVFHCPFYGLPYLQPVPGVVTLHDLTFEHHPEWFGAGRRQAFRLQARHAARTAARILTVSEHVKSDIVRRYGVDPARVLVASHGVDAAFQPGRPGRDAILDRLGVRRPFVLALGGAPRRHLDIAEAAWRLAVAGGRDVGLVVVGGETSPGGGHVRLLGSLADDDFAAVMEAAEAFCYPTGYEGFGLPAVEALASRTPVVCARVGALPEVLGDAAEWCDELTVESFASGLAAVLDDDARADQLGSRGLERVARMQGWEHAAAVHLEAYRAAAGAA